MKTNIVAGGCFWGKREYYRRIKDIFDIKVSYAQNNVINPTYEMFKAQFGTQYQCGTNFVRAVEKSTIEKYDAHKAKEYDRPLNLEVEPLRCIFDVEENHQRYFEKKSTVYSHMDFSKTQKDELKYA